MLVGTARPELAVARLTGGLPRGGAQARARPAPGWASEGSAPGGRAGLPGRPGPVVDTTGAGDAFARRVPGRDPGPAATSGRRRWPPACRTGASRGDPGGDASAGRPESVQAAHVDLGDALRRRHLARCRPRRRRRACCSVAKYSVARRPVVVLVQAEGLRGAVVAGDVADDGLVADGRGVLSTACSSDRVARRCDRRPGTPPTPGHPGLARPSAFGQLGATVRLRAVGVARWRVGVVDGVGAGSGSAWSVRRSRCCLGARRRSRRPSGAWPSSPGAAPGSAGPIATSRLPDRGGERRGARTAAHGDVLLGRLGPTIEPSTGPVAP